MRKKREEKDRSLWRKRIWNGSMVAALLSACTVFGVMLQIEKNMLARYEKGYIWVAAKEIPKGQVINEENYEMYLEECLLDKNVIPATALSEKEQLEEMVAVGKIEEGVLLTTGMFEKRDEITAGMQEPVIAGVKSEDLYQMVGGTLRAGDKIHIYSVKAEEVGPVWENVYVQAVFDQAGMAISNSDTTTPVQRINIYLNKEEVQCFYSELEAGAMRVVKVCD